MALESMAIYEQGLCRDAVTHVLHDFPPHVSMNTRVDPAEQRQDR